MENLDFFKTNSGSGISRFILGAAGCGNSFEEILNYYLSSGGNCLDTAAVYGESERIIGAWLKKSGYDRKKLVIVTKGAHPPRDNMKKSRLTESDIKYDFENSLKDIGTDYIDVYYLHRDDIATPAGYIIEILNKYVKSGNIKALGASNWSVKRINEANEYAKNNGLAGFSFSQICYSLADVTNEEYGDTTLVCMNDTEYNGYIENKIPVMAYTSQARGFFYKNFANPEAATGRFASPKNIKRLLKLKEFCEKKQITPEEAVCAFLTSCINPVTVLPIVAASSIEQIKRTITNRDIQLTIDDIKFLTT